MSFIMSCKYIFPSICCILQFEYVSVNRLFNYLYEVKLFISFCLLSCFPHCSDLFLGTTPFILLFSL